jgi:zinc transport system substrate-binding protein
MRIKSVFKYTIFLIALGSCIACGCSRVHAEEKIHIITTIMPLQYFIEEIGGGRVSVTVMIPPGANPHSYEPVPSQMRSLSNADLYVKVGSGIEFELVWMDKIVNFNRKMAICDASKGIRFITMAEHACAERPVGETHQHGQGDPHIWLSPNNAILMAANIRDALIGLDPERKDFYIENFSFFIIQLDKLKREIADKFDDMENRKFLVFHPAWGYFAADFDLIQISAECSGKELTPRQLAGVIKQAKHHGIRTVFASPQFSQKSAKVIAHEIGGKVIVIDPLSGDYMNNLRETAKAFSQA